MTVQFADGEPNGLASMVGGLIEANLERDPKRRRLLKPGRVAVAAPDAGVSVTIRFAPGRVWVANGLRRPPPPQLRVRADSATLLELSSAPLRLGLPDPLTAEGRRLLGKLLSREIRVAGLLLHPLMLARFNKLLSAA